MPSAVCGVRGTEYTITVDSLGNTSVYVLDGIVDLMGDLNENTITLTPGYAVTVNNLGGIVGVYKFEIDQMEKWRLE